MLCTLIIWCWKHPFVSLLSRRNKTFFPADPAPRRNRSENKRCQLKQNLDKTGQKASIFVKWWRSWPTPQAICCLVGSQCIGRPHLIVYLHRSNRFFSDSSPAPCSLTSACGLQGVDEWRGRRGCCLYTLLPAGVNRTQARGAPCSAPAAASALLLAFESPGTAVLQQHPDPPAGWLWSCRRAQVENLRDSGRACVSWATHWDFGAGLTGHCKPLLVFNSEQTRLCRYKMNSLPSRRPVLEYLNIT